MSGAHPIPAWKVVLDGNDLTDRIAPRLLDLTLTENRGDEADQLDLRIHDHDGAMALPPRGRTLTVALGWSDSGLVNKGTFVVDDVEHSGAPDILTIRARSADLTGAIRRRRERSWHDTTLGRVLDGLAGEHALRSAVAADLASIALPHLDQANESDINLLTRLAKRFDAVATVKGRTLIFARIGYGTTPSGTELPGVQITRAAGDQHRYATSDRDSYSGVRAYWTDRGAGRRRGVLVGTDANEKKLRNTYSSEAEAKQHAEAEFRRHGRGGATLSYTLALGRADVYPEQKVEVSGFKPEIDGTNWLVVKATHTISGVGGFVSQLELETSN